MTSAVLFDLEDTLVQTPWSDFQHVLEFRRETRAKLVELGIPPKVLEGVGRATIMRIEATEYVEENLSKAEAVRFYQEMEKFLSRYELDSAERSKLFSDTIPALKELRRLKVKMGVVTNTSSKAVDVVFRLHSLRRYFDVVITRDVVRRLKPEPEGILLAVRKLGVESFSMVGDLDLDALAAKSAGGKSIIVMRHPDEHLNLQADHIVQSLTVIPKIIQSERWKPRCSK
jgi:HAD superfamily hydrolase (TIGR01549 family)